MNRPIISVIVPIYNASEHIKRCVYSVLAQNFKNFELLLIDDGSTDCSYKICEEFKHIDSRVIVLHKKNEGPHLSRLYGVRNSRGIYINFVDADDTIPFDSLSRLLEKSKKYNLDITQGATHSIFSNTKTKEHSFPKDGLFSRNDFIKFLFKKQCICAPWGSLYKKKIFSQDLLALPKDVKLREDFFMNLCLSTKAKHIGLFNDIIVYNHIENPKSITHNYIFKSINPTIHLLEAIKLVLKRHNLFNTFSVSYYADALFTLTSVAFHNPSFIHSPYLKDTAQKAASETGEIKYKVLSFCLLHPLLFRILLTLNRIRKKINTITNAI